MPSRGRGGPPPQVPGMAGPLTARELEVLRLLAPGTA